MIPRLAFECREVGQFRKLIRRCFYERELALFARYHQHVLLGQENHLAVAVALALPLELAVLEVDANERAAVEPEHISLMNDEIVEPWINIFRRPTLLHAPAAGPLRYRNTSQSTAITHTQQQVAVRRETWLRDRNTFPMVFPQNFSVSRRDAHRTFRIQQHDLLHSIHRLELWRTVASGVRRADPAWVAGGEIVSHETTGCREDDEIVNNQR